MVEVLAGSEPTASSLDGAVGGRALLVAREQAGRSAPPREAPQTDGLERGRDGRRDPALHVEVAPRPASFRR